MDTTDTPAPTKILVVLGGINHSDSRTRFAVSNHVNARAAELTAPEDETPQIEVTVLDLATTAIPSASFGPNPIQDALIGALEAADEIVIACPMYNFGIPGALKLWVDQICVAGRTFYYTPEGPVGLLKGKKAIVVVASGGTPVERDYYCGPYMEMVLKFIGITNVEIVHL